jgi:hypothetical protein
MGEGRGSYSFRWGNLRERDHWGDPGVGGRIILKRIFRKWDVGVWTGLSWLKIQVAGTFKCGNELLGSIKCRDFLISCKPVSFSRRTLPHGVSK